MRQGWEQEKRETGMVMGMKDMVERREEEGWQGGGMTGYRDTRFNAAHHRHRRRRHLHSSTRKINYKIPLPDEDLPPAPALSICPTSKKIAPVETPAIKPHFQRRS
ncbi:hypothetical protein E2C01_083538 [Portunus trituberculatus]|uniref:Uncharacterized protein n=1 Tax=Portunus trituberculatus TaxID=210409 RepID=A0A5B7IXG2_PORTR|nr:hypothetical protein [Portunus trituberculatus]